MNLILNKLPKFFKRKLIKYYNYLIIYVLNNLIYFLFSHIIIVYEARRYSQVVRLWIANPSFPSSNPGAAFVIYFSFWGRGGMVDTTDLKSVD